MTTLVEVAGWAGALEQLVAGLASRFYREAGVQRALSYLRGLLAPLERKNGWPKRPVMFRRRRCRTF